MSRTHSDEAHERQNEMVTRQIEARGVTDEALLDAMRRVPREDFLPSEKSHLATEDMPVPIGAGQTISQPYVVAWMLEALELQADDRVLEVGAGSGYAAAVAGEVADEVYAIERIQDLADAAARRLRTLGYDNVHIRHDDGTKGWPEANPFDAILVSAGGPEIPDVLKEQLAIGGHLVIPVGERRGQMLLKLTRTGEDTYTREELGRVRFVPLIGARGWRIEDEHSTSRALPTADPPSESDLISHESHAFDDIEGMPIDAFLERVGDARVVLLGEASHGSAEFYEARTRLTRALVEEKGFTIVAAEADWPDAAIMNRWVHDREQPEDFVAPFRRFPTWMWGNEQVVELLAWMREHNRTAGDHANQVGFYGLDVYSLHASLQAVLHHLDEIDEELAEVARQRYACIAPYQHDPASYGGEVWRGRHQGCADEVQQMLMDLLRERIEGMADDDDARALDIEQNARVIANAERYYRAMYEGSATSWNIRDRHMFETLEFLLDAGDDEQKAVVWAHNSHVGDASATSFAARDEINIGQFCKEAFGADAYTVGFGTHTGTVAAASRWGGPMEAKRIRPSHSESYEAWMHQSDHDRFMLPLRHGSKELRNALEPKRLERAIGVIYRPETEYASHYFQASLPHQFDEFVWFERTRPVDAIPLDQRDRAPRETYPIGL